MRLNWMCIPLVAPALAVAAKPLPECSSARPKAPCVITIDARGKLVPGPTTVVSGTQVTIRVVNKGPLDDVKFKMDRTAAAPPENPLSTVLTTFNGAAALKALALVTAASTEAVSSANKRLGILRQPGGAPPPSRADETIRTELSALRERLIAGGEELAAIEKTYRDLKKEAAKLSSCGGVDACKQAATTLADKIQQAIARGVPTFDDEVESLKRIDASIGELPPDRRAVYQKDRDAMAAAIQAQQFASDQLFKAQAGLNSLAAALCKAAKEAAAETPPFQVPADSNTDVTVHITFSPDSDPVDVPVVIHFQNWAWATPSAGVAFTAFRRNTYSVAQHFDAKLDPDKQTYAKIQRDVTTRQLIPISLVNFQTPWTTTRCHGVDIGLTASIGVGVNVSTQEAEFVAGPGLHIGRAQFVIGAHWARSASLTNGFTEGQPVAADLVPPVSNPYTAHWGVSITYRLR